MRMASDLLPVMKSKNQIMYNTRMNKLTSQKNQVPSEKVAKKFISDRVEAREKENRDEKKALFDKFEIQTKTKGFILKNFCN